MNILVTGASSYVAKYIVEYFLSRGYHVIGTSRSNPQIENPEFEWIKHDLSAQPLKLNIKIDLLVHVAGLAWMDRRSSEYVQSNVIVTWNVLKTIYALSPRLVVYTSTRDVYGEVKDKILTENSNILNPIVYGHTKYISETLIKETSNYLILRLPSVIGIGTHGWIQSIFEKLIKNEEIQFTNSAFNNIIHACEIPKIIETIFNKNLIESNIFLLGCSNQSTSEKVIIKMKSLISSKSNLIEISSGDTFYTISIKKISKFYKPMTVEDSIAMYVDEMQQKKRNIIK